MTKILCLMLVSGIPFLDQVVFTSDSSLNRDEENWQEDIWFFSWLVFHLTPLGWGSSSMLVAKVVAKASSLYIHYVPFINFVVSIVTCVGLLTRD